MLTSNRSADPLKSSAKRAWLARGLLLAFLLSPVLAFSACSDAEDSNTKTEKSDAGKEPAIASLQRVEGNTPYSIDAINGKAVPKAGPVIIDSASTPAIVIGGWAIDVHAKSSAGGVIFNVDGSSDLTATYGGDRQDVADGLKEPNYKMSGFGISIPTASLEKGNHTLGVKIVTAKKDAYYQPSQKIAIDIR